MKINQAFPIFQRATLPNTVRPGYEATVCMLHTEGVDKTIERVAGVKACSGNTDIRLPGLVGHLFSPTPKATILQYCVLNWLKQVLVF